MFGSTVLFVTLSINTFYLEIWICFQLLKRIKIMNIWLNEVTPCSLLELFSRPPTCFAVRWLWLITAPFAVCSDSCFGAHIWQKSKQNLAKVHLCLYMQNDRYEPFSVHFWKIKSGFNFTNHSPMTPISNRIIFYWK